MTCKIASSIIVHCIRNNLSLQKVIFYFEDFMRILFNEMILITDSRLNQLYGISYD